MNKSESIANLAIALSKLQGEIKDVVKDERAHKHKYAKLCSILEESRPLCLKYELSVAQLCSNGETTEIVGVETILMHSSGEWISSKVFMNIGANHSTVGNMAQAAGCVITYARRYALAAILGITQVDDDAESAGVQQEVVRPPKQIDNFDDF